MLVEAQVRLEELLRDVVQRPEVDGELGDLCQEMDRL